ncbi:SDR family NAD(P)-dependent oxidoreductase [Bacteriovoracales bacterium]|nr:SDR family NAD(P)-dependent oxidoreductase [Bacteriovoracales bacterium]
MILKNIAVTGAGGFIGRSLALELANRGYFVRALDNNFRGSLDSVSEHKNIENIECDILDPKQVRDALNGTDIVFHLAAINGTENFYKIPEKVLEVGVIGTHNVVKACLKNKIKKFAFASSSETYNIPDIVPTPETITLKVPDVFNPRFSYGGGKLAGELIVINYFRNTDAKFTIFRPHNVYGPQMGFEHVIPQIVKKIFLQMKKIGPKESENINLEIQGEGSETRSFIFIDEFIKALIHTTIESDSPKIINIGTQEEISIYNLVKEIGKICKLELNIKKSKVVVGSPSRRCPDTSKLKEIGFVSSVPLVEGLEKTVNWYMDYYQSENLQARDF